MESLEEISKVRDQILPHYEKCQDVVLKNISNKKAFYNGCFNEKKWVLQHPKYGLTRDLTRNIWKSAYANLGKVLTNDSDRKNHWWFVAFL